MLNHKYLLILGFILLIPSFANAYGGSQQPGGIFIIFLPIAVILFLLINKRYFPLIFRDKKIMFLTIIPLLIIGVITAYKVVEIKKEYNVEMQEIINCQLENDKRIKEQNFNEASQWGSVTRPCGVPDTRSDIIDAIEYMLNFLFCYSIFMILYGIYEIKKKNSIGKKILKFSISFILLVIFVYISHIMMSTVISY